MAEMLKPIPIESELSAWVVVDDWNARVARGLSDELIQEWFDLFGRRITGMD